MMLKIKPDLQKSKALIEMAKITIARLNELDIYKYPTNTLTDYYDAIHKLMESITLGEGIKMKGDGAHQELIDYVSRKYNLGEADRIFMQEMRDFRNRTSYEGFMVKKEYIESNIKRIKNILTFLGNLLGVKIL